MRTSSGHAPGGGLLVVGTDTGVGKTTVSVALVAALVEGGARVGVMKPCESGEGDDGARLLEACGRPLDPALVRPYQLRAPLAPSIAARREGVIIELSRVVRAYRALSAQSSLMVVEGAGGLLVPLSARATVADLATRLALPLLVVARTALGTINHTLLTLEVAAQRGLPLVGVVFSRATQAIPLAEEEAVTTIVRLSGIRSLGILPWLPAAVRRSPARLAAEARRHLPDLIRATSRLSR